MELRNTKMDKEILRDQYCDCFCKSNEFIGEGKIIGFHGAPATEYGCGGYITDKMLKAHNPKHYKLRQNVKS